MNSSCSINIPKECNKLPKNAFANCSSLEQLTIHYTKDFDIDQRAFHGCISLHRIYIILNSEEGGVDKHAITNKLRESIFQEQQGTIEIYFLDPEALDGKIEYLYCCDEEMEEAIIQWRDYISKTVIEFLEADVSGEVITKESS